MTTTRDSGQEWQKYRWEFMRRDPEYIEAYQKAKELRSKANLPELKECRTLLFHDHRGAWAMTGPGEGQECQYETPEAKEILNLARRFDIIEFVDPQTNYDDLEPWYRHVMFSQIEGVAALIDDSDVVQICIDFSKINSICNLKAQVSEIIDIEFETRKTMGSKRSTDYDRIIQSGDLKKQGLLNWEIAERIFQDEFRGLEDSECGVGEQDYESADRKINICESAIRKISNYLKRYKELTSGGYKLLRPQ
jgi:hypothetical protein